LLDASRLKGKIVEKNTNIEELSRKIGINHATFYRKLKNNSFSIEEADKIAVALSLTNEEATAIFFSQFVA